MITNHKYGLRDFMGLNSKILLVSLLAISFGYMIYSYAVVDSLDCSEEKGECYSTTISEIIDGNVIQDSDGRLIELSLVSMQELHVSDGSKSKEYVESVCPVGSSILVDEDDLQLSGKYDAMMAKITCKGINLNHSLLTSNHGIIDTSSCKYSEFSEESWAAECN